MKTIIIWISHGHWFISVNIFTDFTSERAKPHWFFSEYTYTTDWFSKNFTDSVLERRIKRDQIWIKQYKYVFFAFVIAKRCLTSVIKREALNNYMRSSEVCILFYKCQVEYQLYNKAIFNNRKLFMMDMK